MAGMLQGVLDSKYELYVLVILMVAFLVNQFKTFSLIATNASMAQEIQYGDRQCEARDDLSSNASRILQQLGDALKKNISINEYCLQNEQLCEEEAADSLCYWHYLGRGNEYQILAGPVFIILFAVSGIPLGLISELRNINRKVCLVLCIFLWSAMTVLGGFSTRYWHLAISRLLMGVFSAGCVPFCTSMIADYFSAKHRGAAIGFFNWGVFVGYSLTFLLIIVEQDFGWRAVYFVSGAPGFLLGIIIAITVKEPERRNSGQQDEEAIFHLSSRMSKLTTAFRSFADPVLLMLCLAGAVRNGAGLVWAYNILLFFNEYWPGTNVEFYMSWIPLVFGSTAVFGGGYISDRLSHTRGIKGRLLVLIFCCISSAPFQAALLFLPPPWCFVSNIVGILLGEMWLGVCASIVVELSPTQLTTSCLALYYFIIQIIGGNMNLFITPITNNLNLRTALLICFPGFYVIGGLLFICTLLLYSVTKSDTDDKDDVINENVVDSESKVPLKEIDKDENLEASEINIKV